MPHADAASRRAFLRSGATGALLAALPWGRCCALGDESPYGPFKMSIQSYSLRAFDTADALAKSRALGLRYWESFSKHFPLTDSATKLAEYKKLLGDHGITLLAYGVERFGKDSDANRREFEFARAMGIVSISADPDPETLDQLDRLVEEYGIRIAIHNHGPGSRYATVEDVLRAMRNHHERIGACVDTGHYLRSDVDPVAAIRAFGARTYGVHLKDVKNLAGGKKQFTVLGRGDLDVVGCLRELQKLRFAQALSLEYEENEKDPIEDIRACLAAVAAAVQKV